MVTGKFNAKRYNAVVHTAKKIHHALLQRVKIQWKGVKGHSGNLCNEKADKLAEPGKMQATLQGERYGIAPLLTPDRIPIETPHVDNDSLEEACTRLAAALQEAEKQTIPVMARPKKPGSRQHWRKSSKKPKSFAHHTPPKQRKPTNASKPKHPSTRGNGFGIMSRRPTWNPPTRYGKQ